MNKKDGTDLRLRTPSMEQNERTVFLLRIERKENGTISKKS